MKRRIKTLYAASFVVLCWYLLHFALRTPAVPSPHKTFINFAEIFLALLLPNLGASLLRIAAALSISFAAGTALGIFIGMNARADKLISPVVYLLYPLPKIAFLPILMILFGLGNTPKIMLIIGIIVFQFVLAARDGVREVPYSLKASVRSLKLTRIQTVRHLILPACLPNLFTALRISVGVSISVLFFAENFAASYGIGYFIMNAWSMGDYLQMFSGILALAVSGLIIFGIIDLCERRICRYGKISS